MRGWTRAVLLAALACAVASACARGGEITTPAGARPNLDGVPGDSTAVHSDSSGGRWGGFIGSGG